jgi:hypothetical protein
VDKKMKKIKIRFPRKKSQEILGYYLTPLGVKNWLHSDESPNKVFSS